MRRAGVIAGVAAVIVTVACLGTAASLAATKPPGYVRVPGTMHTAPPDSYVLPSLVSCPAGKVIWGGGVFYLGGFAHLGQNIVATLPVGTTAWEAKYNNATADAAMFTSDAICANKPLGYKIVFATADSPVGAQVGLSATCPRGKVVLSGGAQVTADNPGSWLTSEAPISQTTFRVVNYNGTIADESLTVFAVCAKRPAGYRIVTGSFNDPDGPDTDLGSQSCPKGTVVIGGGMLAAHPNPMVSLGSESDTSATDWEYEVENAMVNGTITMHGKAICAA